MQPEFMKPLSLALRISQLVCCIISLATAGLIADYAGIFTPEATGLAIFASVTGLAVSSLLLASSLVQPTHPIARSLPGLIDVILSGLWAVFFLAAGAATAAIGTCRSRATLCGSWNAVAAFGFLNFVSYDRVCILW